MRRAAGTSLLVALLLTSLSLVWSPGSGWAQDRTTILSTGNPTGMYHRVGEGIQASVDADLVVVPSEGSRQNLDRLRAGVADWAIVQRDDAVEAYYDRDDAFQEFEILAPLFPEALQLLVRRDVASIDPRQPLELDHLVRMIRTGRVRTLAVGPRGSGSNRLIRDALSLFGISEFDGIYDEREYDESIRALARDSIDALAIMAAFPSDVIRDSLLARGQVRLVSLREAARNRIVDHLEQLDPVTIPRGTYPGQTEDVSTVGTWAFLLRGTGNGADRTDERRSSPLGAILSSFESVPELDPVARTLGENGELEFSGEGFSGSNRDLAPFFRGLPLSDEAAEVFGVSGVPRTLNVAMLALVIVILALVAARVFAGPKLARALAEENVGAYMARYKHHFLAILLIVVLFLGLSETIRLYERNLYEVHHVESPMALSRFDLLTWLMIFSASGYTDDIFPVTPQGKLAASVSPLLVWLALGLAIVIEVVIRERNKRRRRGKAKVTHTGHIVICGFNERVPDFVRRAIESQNGSFAREKRVPYVIVDPRFKAWVETDERLRRLNEQGRIFHVDGDARDTKSLQKANVDQARAVILFADDKSTEADDRTWIRAMKISRHCREKAGAGLQDVVYMVAEVNDHDLRESLMRDADVNEVVCSADISENILLQSAYNRGVSEILDELLAYDQFNEFYVLDVARTGSLRGSTFDDALVALRKHGILLLGIKLGFHEGGKEVIDIADVKELIRERYGIERHIITNPLTEAENRYTLGEHDSLFVLAASERAIEEFVSVGDAMAATR